MKRKPYKAKTLSGAQQRVRELTKIVADYERYAQLQKADYNCLLAAINWAMGASGEFRERTEKDGAYWWRTELAERAGIKWDGKSFS